MGMMGLSQCELSLKKAVFLFPAPCQLFHKEAPISPSSISVSFVATERLSPALTLSSLNKLEQQN